MNVSKKISLSKKKSLEKVSNYFRSLEKVSNYFRGEQNIKINCPKNADGSDSRYIRAGYDIESKPSYSEEKLEGVSSFFHRRWMQFKGRKV
jgi:hypothetical protein